MSIDQLPCVTEEQIEALLGEIEELLAEHGERIVVGPEMGRTGLNRERGGPRRA